MTTTTDKLDCGHVPTSGHSPGTGHAHLPDGRRACYSCADTLAAEGMAATGEVFAYLSSDGRNVTTWSGGVLARVTGSRESDWRTTPTGGQYRTTYVTARDAAGDVWHGQGPGAGMYVRLRRSKARR